MDFLGSILSKMEPPPKASDKEKEEKKRQEEFFKKRRDAEKDARKKFSEKMKEYIQRLIDDQGAPHYVFPPMDRVKRTILHELVSENEALVSYSFGEEGHNRHCVVYKKHSAPTDEQLMCLRNGIDHKRYIEKKRAEQENKEASVMSDDADKKRKCQVTSSGHVTKRSADIIGPTSEGVKSEAEAVNIRARQGYGMVSTSLKLDKRSIEEVMEDNRKKKRLNLMTNPELSATSSSQSSSLVTSSTVDDSSTTTSVP